VLSAFDRDAERQRLLTRRTLVLGGLKAAAVSALAGRLYYLQVVESDRYTTLAEDNRISLRLIAPPRGLIVDRNGVPLAVNEQNFRLILVSERAGDVERTLDQIAQLIAITESDRKRILRDIQRSRAFAPITVRENLGWEEVSAIEVNLPDLPGVSIDVGQVRSYPFGEATAHFTGYVGAVSEQELQGAEDPLLTLPGFRIGKSGVEKLHDLALRGSAGTLQLEVNAVGRVVRELSRMEGQPGRQVTLTIDAKLQHYAQQRLASEVSASAVIMDVQTGGIQAWASHPSYDPNQFSMGISGDLWRSLSANEAKPLINKVLAGEYPPGSTFKMIVGLAALEAGISPDARVFCPGHYTFGGHRFHCWKKHGHGAVDMYRAIAHSCDVYFYDVSRRVGIDRIASMARRFGLGQRTEVDLPGERAGIMPDTKWKKAKLREPWYEGETLVASIGQGYITTTPLQLAVMTARIANGGFAVQPHITKRIEALHEEKTSWPEIGVDPKHLDLVRRAMSAVTNEPGATAYGARIQTPGMEMAGKTGTVQVRRISKAERATGVKKGEDLPWKYRDHAMFVAFAPVHAPKFACAVVVEHGIAGGRVAAPIARDILAECQLLNSARTSVAEARAPAPPDTPGPAPSGERRP